MPEMRVNDEAQIYDNKARIIGLEADMRNAREDVKEIKLDIKVIKENHLAHIQKSIEEINLKLARLDPQNKIVWKVIEYIVLAVIVAGISYLVTSKGV